MSKIIHLLNTVIFVDLETIKTGVGEEFEVTSDNVPVTAKVVFHRPNEPFICAGILIFECNSKYYIIWSDRYGRAYGYQIHYSEVKRIINAFKEG